MRKLVTVRKVEEKKPIPEADLIEAVRVDGWWLVTKKDEFQVGDLGIYFEIDSLIPTYHKQFAFLKNGIKYEGKDYYKIRTIKLRKQISQGLLIPLSSAPISQEAGQELFDSGEDLSDFFQVIKWEPYIPAQLAGKVRGNFPQFIPKTDQERVQNCWNHIVKYIEDDEAFEETIKLEGSSCTMYLNNGVFGVCSRNLDLAETEENSYWKVARQYKYEEILRAIGRNLAIQGELIGEGVQGNHEQIQGLEFHVFDIFDIDAQKYLNQNDRLDLFYVMKYTAKSLFDVNQLHHAHITTNVILKKQFQSLDDLLKTADGPSVYNKKSREGLVYKQVNPKTGSPFSFKVISNEYLLSQK